MSAIYNLSKEGALTVGFVQFSVFFVVGDFFEDGLERVRSLPENIPELFLINGHTVGVSVLNGLIIQSVPVLSQIGFLLLDLSQLLLQSFIDHLLKNVPPLILLILNLVHEISFLLETQASHMLHKGFESFLVLLMLFKLGLTLYLFQFHVGFEFFTVCVHCFKDLGRDEFFVFEFSYFGF